MGNLYILDRRMTKDFSGVFVDAVHFAVSGKCR